MRVAESGSTGAPPGATRCGNTPARVLSELPACSVPSDPNTKCAGVGTCAYSSSVKPGEAVWARATGAAPRLTMVRSARRAERPEIGIRILLLLFLTPFYGARGRIRDILFRLAGEAQER